ncbi:MAG: hypothetical protein WCC32_21065 [Terriglobales bacterium]
MNLVGLFGTAVLSLTLVAAAPVYAQEQHDQQEDKAKPAEEKKAQPEEKKAQAEKSKPEEKNAREKGAPVQKAHAQIPADRYKANFGQQHRFHVSQADYNGRRFSYGGYSFGFVDPWPSNWLYTQDVYVVEINGVYYLCNASFPGVNLTLSFTL